MKFLNALLDRVNIKVINRVFIFSIVTILTSHTLFSAGLNHDGVFNLLHMVFNNSFFFLEKSRTFFDILYQFPAYFFIKFSSVSSLAILSQIFSFSLIWIHIFSLLICYFIIPNSKKPFIFFPLFGFFMGPVTALGISVSVALSVCSYVWLTAFIIYYSDLSKKIHRVVFILIPLPLLLSHEMMSYMAWPLIFLCRDKNKKEKTLFNKTLIMFVISVLLITSFVQISMILLHGIFMDSSSNIINFTGNLINFKFLFSESKIALPIIFATVTLLSSFIEFFKVPLKDRILNTLGIMMVSGFLFLIIISPVFHLKDNFLFYSAYDLRVYPPVIALPLSLLLWWLCEKQKINIQKRSKAFLLSCVFCCLSLTFFRLSSDDMFYKHQMKFSQQLRKCKGLLNWDEHKNNFQLVYYGYNWKSFEESLIYPRSKIIEAVFPYSHPECIEDCKKKKKICHEICEERSSYLFKLEKLHLSRFFDTKAIRESILNHISQCEDQ